MIFKYIVNVVSIVSFKKFFVIQFIFFLFYFSLVSINMQFLWNISIVINLLSISSKAQIPNA